MSALEDNHDGEEEEERRETNELSTASWYYAFYRMRGASHATEEATPPSTLLPPPPEAQAESSTSSAARAKRDLLGAAGGETSANEEADDDDGESSNFWVEDVWTDRCKDEAEERLSRAFSKCDIASSSPMGESLVRRFEMDAGRNWDKFYDSNQTNFFKDRHYLHKAFPEEFGPLYAGNADVSGCIGGDQGAPAREIERAKVSLEGNVTAPSTGNGKEETFNVVEIGCGVGNAVLPLLEQSTRMAQSSQSGDDGASPAPKLVVWGLDFSPVAIDLLKNDPRFVEAASDGRARADVWDVTTCHPDAFDGLTGVAHVSVLLFCLSAISPGKMPDAARHVAATLHPGGILVLRDYGRYDEAQMKLGTSRGRRLGENFYVKRDGTRCYYFDLEDLRSLFGGAGLEICELKYVRRVYNNRAERASRRRIWVQGRFRKPDANDVS